MSELYDRARRNANEIIEDSVELFSADVEDRANLLEKAVNDGWFIPLLRGAEVTGLGIANVGLAVNNSYVAGFGLGLSSVAGVYDFLIYRAQKRGRDSKESNN